MHSPLLEFPCWLDQLCSPGWHLAILQLHTSCIPELHRCMQLFGHAVPEQEQTIAYVKLMCTVKHSR